MNSQKNELSEYEKITLNNYATTCFRDVADQDYIAARSCYKIKLGNQFYWFSQQAIEKYLKAILLFNGVEAKKQGHNLIKCIDKIKLIQDFEFDFSEDVLGFICKLNIFGVNRYLEKFYTFDSKDILLLDKTIWEIRRYCKPLTFLYGNKNLYSVKMAIKSIHKLKVEGIPHKFKIGSGYLEKIITKRIAGQYEVLTWKNLYFGRRNKKYITYSRSYSGINPPHLRNKEAFEIIKEYVKFPSDVKKYFDN